MTGLTPNERSRRFRPDELEDVDGITAEELAAEAALARELEAAAVRGDAPVSASFADRVMAALEDEPSPVPARAAGRAIRRVSLGALVLAIRDAWRVTVGHGFPAVIRAQALAIVLVVVALGAGTATATAGALGLFAEPQRSPVPELPSPAVPSDVPSPSDPPLVSPSPAPDSTSPAETATPEPSETPEPTETAEPDGSFDDHGGDSSGSDDSSGHGSDHSGSGSDDSDSHSGSSNSGSGSSGSSGSGSNDHDDDSTPRATETPKPGETPKATSESGGHG